MNEVETKTMQAEKLNLWDRIFNRYRKEVIEEGVETWKRRIVIGGFPIEDFHFLNRQFIKYKIIDRLTGSEKIKKEYLT